ncbi:MAG: protein kinase [Thermoactinospora sp.]|nr:protein kinase [Thermoactinospora sp.]
MTACREPGCPGQIADGYCDYCGNPDTTTGSAPITAASAPSSPVSSTPVSTPMSTPMSSPVTSPVSRSTGSTGSASRSRGELRDDLDDLPQVPVRNPQDVIMANPMVPEHKRVCVKCDELVGQSIAGNPGRTRGFCPRDRTPFDFEPKLGKGDLVAGQYEVEGALAHGGLGWIYLASDRNLDGKWMVLKGLLNAGDTEAMIAAEAERRFLITVDHPNIVKIYNFCQHQGAGYIVMEYVGGPSLAELRKQGLIPMREAIRYGLEILKAFGYLHDEGLVYCDLKPHNAIRVGKQLKLIDLGAVQRLGSPAGTSWATVGYYAPEVEKHPATVSSDLYTVARTIAALCVPGFSPTTQGKVNPLPADCGDDSFRRVLMRATAQRPERRFQSSAEMAEQLRGVLRELSAAEEGRPYESPSNLFGPDRLAHGRVTDRPGPDTLPAPQVDPDDPAAGALAGLIARNPAELIAQLDTLQETPEVVLAKTRVLAENALPGAREAIVAASRALPGDWRVTWCQGLLELAEERGDEATALFEEVLSFLPGELAPKLALGLAAEVAGHDPARWYEVVWRTNRTYVSAAFGMARHRLRAGDLDGAITVLEQVPRSSSRHTAAVLTIVEALARSPRRAEDLPLAADRLEELHDLDQRRRDLLITTLLETALRFPGAPGLKIAGTEFAATAVRHRLSDLYRRLAKASDNRQERHEYVDRANAVRPRTWI